MIHGRRAIIRPRDGALTVPIELGIKDSKSSPQSYLVDDDNAGESMY